jgi:flavin-dependent dehydrogenase
MENYDVIVIGAGPAGSAAATTLARAGVSTLVLEEKHMPREKVCGEFITPECFPTLERLGLMPVLVEAGARQISTLTLCAANGRILSTPISDVSGSAAALGLSRGRLDQLMLDRARSAGATCIEGAAVKQCTTAAGRPIAVEALLLKSGKTATFESSIVIDASGRNSRLMVTRAERQGGTRGSRLYAMKTHLKGVEDIDSRVELYFFKEGYGGCSVIEGGLANLCFITTEQTVRACGGDPARILERSVMNNPVARTRLRSAEPVGKWLTVGPLVFGKRRLSQDGVIAIGDAAGMIDPFTGTGIQIALRSGEMIADSIVEASGMNRHGNAYVPGEAKGRAAPDWSPLLSERLRNSYDWILTRYRARYEAEFGRRMAAAGLLRRAAFSLGAANLLGAVLVAAPWLANRMLRATRSGGHRPVASLGGAEGNIWNF